MPLFGFKYLRVLVEAWMAPRKRIERISKSKRYTNLVGSMALVSSIIFQMGLRYLLTYHLTSDNVWAWNINHHPVQHGPCCLGGSTRAMELSAILSRTEAVLHFCTEPESKRSYLSNRNLVTSDDVKTCKPSLMDGGCQSLFVLTSHTKHEHKKTQ